MDIDGCGVFIFIVIFVLFAAMGGCCMRGDLNAIKLKEQYEKGFKAGQIEASKGNWKYKQVEVKKWIEVEKEGEQK